MKEKYYESKHLISKVQVNKEYSLVCYFPLLSTLAIVTSTTLSMILPLLSSDFTNLSKLPLEKPKIFQLGIFMGLLPSIISIWSFHYLIWNQLKNSNNRNLVVGFSFILGILTQTFLTLFALVPIEESYIPLSFIKAQENIFLAAFMITSVIYESMSLTLILLVRSSKLISYEDLWPNIKISIFATILLVSSANLSLLFCISAQSKNSTLKFLYNISTYMLFFLHQFFTGSFYWDLQGIRFRIKFDDEENAKFCLNSSTF